MALTAHQLRWLFGPAGPFHRNGVQGSDTRDRQAEGAGAAAVATAGTGLVASAGADVARRRKALSLEKAVIRHRLWAQEKGFGALTEAPAAAAAGTANPGPPARPLRAVLAGRHERDGHKFLQYHLVDGGGRQLGGVGITVDPEGRAWTGGVPEKALWSFADLKPGETRSMIAQLKTDEPSVKAIYGMTPKAAARAGARFAPQEAAAGAKLAAIEQQAAKGQPWAAIARVRGALLKRRYFQKIMLPEWAQSVSVVGSNAPSITGQDAIAYKGLHLAQFGGRDLYRLTRAKRIAGHALLGGAVTAGAALALDSEARNLEAHGRTEDARRLRMAGRVAAAGATGIGGYRALRAGLSKGLSIGRRIAARAV